MRLLFGSGNTALRVITALFDAEGHPQTISDLIASDQGQQQETLGGRFDTHDELHGTYWLTISGEHMPRAITAAEKGGLRAFAVLIRERCDTEGQR